MELSPWQQQVWDSSDLDERYHVDVLCNFTDRHALSPLAEKMELHGRGLLLPHTLKGELLQQTLTRRLFANKERTPGCVLIDATGASQSQLNDIYTATRAIKTGHTADTRWHYRGWDFDTPAVWVFCDTRPDPLALPGGRWRLWQLGDRDELVHDA